jgi:hypothetical protein
MKTIQTTMALLLLLGAACGDGGGGSATPQQDTGADGGDAADAGDAGDTADTPEPDVAPDADVPEMDAGPVDLGEAVGPDEARAGFVTEEAQLIGGLKADGRIGDIKLYNSEIRVIIETEGRSAGGYRFWGGNIVDGDVVRPQGEPGRDLFGEIGLSWNLGIFQPTGVEIVSNGSIPGTAAHVRLTGINGRFDWAESFVRAIVSPSAVQVEVTYDYILEPGAKFVQQTMTVRNVADEDANIDFPLILSNHGDGLRQWNRNQGFGVEMGGVDAIRLASRDVSYAFEPMDTAFSVIFEYSNVVLTQQGPMFLTPGEETARTYRFHVTDQGDSGLNEGIADDARLLALVRGTVTLPDTADAATGYVTLFRNERPSTFAPLAADGTYEIYVAAGTYKVQAYVDQHAPSDVGSLELEEGGDASWDTSIDAAATLRVSVEEVGGDPVPARVMAIVPEDDETTVSPYPVAAARVGSDGDWGWVSEGNGGKISGVGMAALDGATTILVPAGRYRVVASRGFEYEIDETEITVVAGETADIELTIEKVVDTTGWISSDFHIHALRSPDSDTDLPTRALQALTENLDAPMITEHTQIGSVKAVAEALGFGEEVVSPPAQEVTTFAYGHFNAFPMAPKPGEFNGGAVFPYDKTPAELFTAIRDQNEGDEIIQVNHPRGGGFGSYFSWAEYDATTGVAANPGWDLNWDAIEVFNGSCGGGSQRDTYRDWVSFTNVGARKVLASGGDSHRENDPIGLPRNWIQVDKAAAAADPQALVAAVKARRMTVSCGPFVTMTASTGEGLGSTIGLDEVGSVTFQVQVQAPSWIDLVEVRLLRNGDPIDAQDITITEGGVRFEGTFTDSPEADAWYAVEVLGQGRILPVHKNGPPYAATNPIEVDADGDGEWTPPGL